MLTTEQLNGDITSAKEQVDEATGAVDSIVNEVASLEQNHTKQKVALIHLYLTVGYPH
jgi:hypothetical protein